MMASTNRITAIHTLLTVALEIVRTNGLRAVRHRQTGDFDLARTVAEFLLAAVYLLRLISCAPHCMRTQQSDDVINER